MSSPPSRPSADAAAQAARSWWDADAGDYQRDHGGFLGDVDLVWCPEGLTESEEHLLGDVTGKRVLEVGCGGAAGSRWVTSQGGYGVGIDLSAGMLAVAQRLGQSTGIAPPLIQADARALPFADHTFDLAFSAFGAVPFVPDAADVYREVARVLRPGGTWVFSAVHPFAWVFADDAEELRVVRSYTNPVAYEEFDGAGELAYAEYPHTMADHVNGLVKTGFRVVSLLEPVWRAGRSVQWGGYWNEERAGWIPGTVVISGVKDGGSLGLS